MGVLVAAGGTGQEIAAAVMRLAYLCGLRPPETFVIDSDLAGNNRETVSTRQQVVDLLHRRLVSTGAVASSFLTVLNPASLNRPDKTSGSVRHIEDVFSTHGTLDQQDRSLIDLLFDSAQQQTRIDDGFHGQPAVGALVVAAATANGAWSQLTERIRKLAEPASGVDVVITGSVTGGVGTSVLPAVVRVLGTDRPDRMSLSGVFQLPWFLLEEITSEKGGRPDVTPGMMDRNATCLVRGYLEQTIGRLLDRAILIGLPDRVTRPSYGGSRQPETRHYVNVVSALHALSLATSESSRKTYSELRGLLGTTIGDDSRTHFQGPPDGPAVGDTHLGKIVNVSRSMVSFTAALLFELVRLKPSVTHQDDVRQVLRGLTGTEREQFRHHVQTLHDLHAEIWDWLADSIESRVGGDRADHGSGAFTPSESWASFRRVSARRASGLIASVPIPIERRLIQAAGPYPSSPGLEGRSAAWAMVNHARTRFLST